MGHWSEDLVDEVTHQIGPVDRTLLLDALLAAGREAEVMSGRSFHSTRSATSVFEPNGLPFVDVPDVNVGSIESERGVWEIPDPVDPTHATALQILPLEPPFGRAASVGRALTIAGHLVSEVSSVGALSGDRVVHWLGASRMPSGGNCSEDSSILR